MSRYTRPDRWGIAEPDDTFLVAFWRRKDGNQDVKVYVFDGYDVVNTPVSGFVFETGGLHKINIKCGSLIEAIALGVVDPYSLRDKKITYEEVISLIFDKSNEIVFASCKDVGRRRWKKDLESDRA